MSYDDQEARVEKGGRHGNRKKAKECQGSKRIYPGSSCRKIQVTRQTISNWENEKSYPDIMSVVNLSNLYEISLDELLKGDKRMLEHLEESTNIVKSNKKLVVTVITNIVLLLTLVLLSSIAPNREVYLVVVFALAIVSFSLMLYQIIKRL